jgi:hypothetical protein
MRITASQDAVIALALNEQGKTPYNREKSSITFEAGSTQMANDGREWYIGSFIAKIYRKGTFRFDTRFELWGNGEQVFCVFHKKIVA